MTSPAPSRLGRLHVLTDTTLQSRFHVLELAQRLLDGGAEVLQFREKRPLPPAQLARDAAALQELCTAAGAQLIIDDRVELAVAVGAGVHLGPRDEDPRSARPKLADGALLGATVNGPAHLEALEGAPVDYLGIGPVRATSSKANPAPTLGLSGLRELVQAAPHPVIAIGGLRVEDVAAVRAAGAHGIAVLGAVVLAEDPRRATEAFARALEASAREVRS